MCTVHSENFCLNIVLKLGNLNLLLLKSHEALYKKEMKGHIGPSGKMLCLLNIESL